MSLIPQPGSIVSSRPLANVLIVEDSWNVAQSLKGIVEKAGAHVLGPVPSVREALEIAWAGNVSLALVDMNLKDSFADPLVDELIALNIPYVIITAYEALPSNADRAALARMTKPLDHAGIAALVRRFSAPGASGGTEA